MLALDQTDVRLRINAPVDWPGGRLPARFSAKDSEQLVRVYSDMTFMSLVPHDLLAPEVIYFTEEQMEGRTFVLRHAYKAARTIVREAISR